MMFKKFGIVLVLIMIMAITLTFGTVTEAAEYELTFAGIHSEDAMISQIYKRWFDLVEERTDGRVEFKSYWASSLGSPREIAEAVKNGNYDIMAGGIGDLSVYAPICEVILAAPYVYQTPEQGMEVLNKIWPTVQEHIREKGFIVLAPYYQGTEQHISKVVFTTIEELQNKKKRSVPSPLMVKKNNAFGFDTREVAFNEVYTALQTGLVETSKGSYDTFLTLNWYEQANNIIVTDTTVVMGMFTLSEKTWNELPEDLQNIFEEAAWEVANTAVNIVKSQEKEMLLRLIDEGVNVIHFQDKDKLAERVQPVIKEHAESIGPEVLEILEEIYAMN